jgi:RNA polymerase sigma factor for flagellar operon FliA
MTPERNEPTGVSMAAALITQFVGLAQTLARRKWQAAPEALDLDELTSIAYFGLVTAATRWEEYCAGHEYDSGRKDYFKAYAMRRINGAMIDEMRRSDWLSRTVRAKSKRLVDAGATTGATVAELVERTKMTEADVRTTLATMATRPVSVEGAEVDVRSRELVESASAVSSALSVFRETVENLPRPHKMILALKYFQLMEIAEIAIVMGMTEARVYQAHTEAVLAVHSALVEATSEFV